MSELQQKGRVITDKHRQAAANLKRIWQECKSEHPEYTQDYIADRLDGITQGAISQYMNAIIALNTDAILKFSNFFCVEPDDIWPNFTEEFYPQSIPRRQGLEPFQVMEEQNQYDQVPMSEDERMDKSIDFVDEMLTEAGDHVNQKTRLKFANAIYRSMDEFGNFDVKDAAKLIVAEVTRKH